VKIGKWCQFGGQSGCADHAKIGDRVMVAAKAGIHNDLDDDVVVGGIPAVHIRQWRRYSAVITRLPEVLRRMRALERQVGVEGE